MSYIHLILYRVPKVNQKAFLDILQQARDIYRSYGAEGEALFRLADMTPKFDVRGIWEILPPDEDEEIWLGLDQYRDVDHFKQVMMRTGPDLRLGDLYNKLVKLVNGASRIVRGEFEE